MDEPLLVVEDDAKIASLLADYLQNSGFRTTIESRGDRVEAAVRGGEYALVLLDLSLPGMDGIEVCKRLRAFSDVPIVMVTARVDEIDRLLGLELGADDYICKPFSPREVVARVKTILRRSGSSTSVPMQRIAIDRGACKATVAGHEVELTAIELNLLTLLIEKPGRIFTRAQIIDSMYADARIVSDRTVDSHVKKLRQKIAAHLPDVDVIHSVYGLGYKYEA